MDQILLTLGALTLGGSAAVLLLAWAGRASRGRYGAKWRCWAWLLLCLRLAVPLPLVFHGESRAPIQMEVPNPPAVTQQPNSHAPGNTPSPTSPIVPTGPQGGTSAPNSSGEGSAAPPDHVQPDSPEKKFSVNIAYVLLAVWLIAAAVLLVWNGWAHLRFLSYLRRWSSPVTDWDAVDAFNHLGDQLHHRPRLLVCQGLKVPMLAGLFRPAILLPQGTMTGEELAFSLLHELTHYRRRDIWLKTLVMWVNILYWFNPMMWYMVRLVERDTELACDEDALRRLDPESYSAYGQTILSAVARLQNRNDSL